ncbi:MAG: nicotinate (nicotinamide) nucleotide adenylyltransferase [Oscillospiraceae bacterium]
MRIAVFGGSFNPPHIGHVEAARAALDTLGAAKLIVVPAATPPHKEQPADTPSAEERLALTRAAFAGLPNTEVSDIELLRGGISYTVDTLEILQAQYPDAELSLLMGTDMLMCFEEWKNYAHILELASLAVFPRKNGEANDICKMREHLEHQNGAKIYEVNFTPTDISSTELRTMLRERCGNDLIPAPAYAEIIKHRYYNAAPAFSWLREKSYAYLNEKRIPHVRGCEQTAVSLAERWGADKGLAAEAGILHDITKKLKAEEQLNLCEKYDIIADGDEKNNYKLLHAKTGAALSRELFGISDAVYGAIYWHTTGRENMTLLEKIIYMADYMEPHRDFDGVLELRRLAYENLDDAVILGLQMSLDDLASRGNIPHKNSIKAMEWLKRSKC